MKTICIVTATRAEYGLLKNIIKLVNNDKEVNLLLVVTGTHLSKEFGYTITEIQEDEVPISAEIDILEEETNLVSVSKTMGKACYQFGSFFNKYKPDMLVVLGDRYELIPICMCAINEQIPIAHISGGEITEGAIDDMIRHSISKMSYLHFVACETYRKRVIQLGEEPDRVFNVGDVGVENAVKIKLMNKQELENSIEFPLDMPYGVVTFHPVTLEKMDCLNQVEELLNALKSIKDMKFIITKSNADSGGKEINQKIDEFVQENDNMKAYYSLGIRRYLSAIKYSEFVIGNSSSGIIEAPSLKIPTINIGNRQKGRLQAESIWNCNTNYKDIVDSINIVRTEEFKQKAQNCKNPYGDGNVSELILKIIKKYLNNNLINLKKKFYDIDFLIK